MSLLRSFSLWVLCYKHSAPTELSNARTDGSLREMSDAFGRV